jgi:ribosome-binding protein aMBF1 (putative translation factor)
MFKIIEVIDEKEEVIKCFVADDITYGEKKKKELEKFLKML